MTKTRAVWLFLALLMMSLAATPALGAPPQRVVFHNDFDYHVADCDGFQIVNREQSTVHLTFFYDEDGQLIRVNQLWRGTDTLTNSVTGAKIVSPFSNHATFDLRALTVRQSGLFWHATVPHEGTVFFQAGQVIGINFNQPDEEIVRFTGIMNHDTQALCAALDG